MVFSIAVVGAPGCGKTTVIKKGLKEWRVTEESICTVSTPKGRIRCESWLSWVIELGSHIFRQMDLVRLMPLAMRRRQLMYWSWIVMYYLWIRPMALGLRSYHVSMVYLYVMMPLTPHRLHGCQTCWVRVAAVLPIGLLTLFS